MQLFFYDLQCDDCSQTIVGLKEIPDLQQQTRDIFSSMDDDQLSGMVDWFEAFVDKFCAVTGFRRLKVPNELNVEKDYWDEHSKRDL